MQSFSQRIFKANTYFQKLVLLKRENISLDDFILRKRKSTCVEKTPFPHVVIDDFFKPDIYQKLCEGFNKKLQDGLSDKEYDNLKFHLFEIDYDGYVYTPSATIDPTNPLSIFYSLEWNLFFSKLFNQHTTFETAFAFHHHSPGDRTGFVHHDYTDKNFVSSSRMPNGVIPVNNKNKGDVVSRRIIALIYFLNNDGWKDGDGGETGLYSEDKKTLLKKVAPLNNRLLAFQISHNSMHAFQQNKKNRNSFVQWFHILPQLL